MYQKYESSINPEVLSSYIREIIESKNPEDVELLHDLASHLHFYKSQNRLSILSAALAHLGNKDLLLLKKLLDELSFDAYPELMDITKDILLTKEASSIVLGFLYSYLSQEALRKPGEFDFLLSDYALKVYQEASRIGMNLQPVKITVKFASPESSMLGEPIETSVAKIRSFSRPHLSADFNPKDAYDECIRYLVNEIRAIKPRSKPLRGPGHRACFMPEKAVLNPMSDEEKLLATYHTALRFLLRDPGHIDSYNSYFYNCDEVVGIGFQLAKDAGALSGFVMYLSQIRRAHNTDTAEKDVSALDCGSCEGGSVGRLFFACAQSCNSLIEQKGNQKIDLPDFNESVLDTLISKSALDALDKMLDRFSFDEKEYPYLANLLYFYQLDLLDPGSEKYEAAKESAEAAISYILERKINYIALYKHIVHFFDNGKQINACPEAIQQSLKALLHARFRFTFGFEGAKEITNAWETLRKRVASDLYPKLLVQLLAEVDSLDSSVSFQELLEVILVEEKDIFCRNFIQILPDLANLCVTKYKEIEIKQLLSNVIALKDIHIINEDHLKTFFGQFFKIIKTDTQDFDKRVIAIMNACLDNPRLLMIAKPALQEALKRFLSGDQCEHYQSLHVLIRYVLQENILSSEECEALFVTAAEESLDLHQNHTFLARIAASAQRFEFNLGSIQQEANGSSEKRCKQLEKQAQSKFGSLGIYGLDEKLSKFQELERLSKKGHAQASFGLAKLYQTGHAISNERKWVKNTELAKIYLAIAEQQAKVMKDGDLINQIRMFSKENEAMQHLPCLEEFYYFHQLEFINKYPSPEANQHLQHAMLIAESVDLGTLLLNSYYESKTKEQIQQIRAACLRGMDLSEKAPALYAFNEKLLQHECFIQTSSGAYYLDDPRLVIAELLFQKDFQPVLNVLRGLEAEGIIGNKALCAKLASALSLPLDKLNERLKRIYTYLNKGDITYLANLNAFQNKPSNEIMVEILTSICKFSDIRLKIEMTPEEKLPLSMDPRISYSASSSSSSSSSSQAVVRASSRPLSFSYDSPIGETQTKRAIRTSQLSCQAPSDDPDYIFKCMLMGDSGVGKSNLLLKYVDDLFIDGYISTIGVEFKRKTIEQAGLRVRLQIWDTCGQERFRALNAVNQCRGAHAVLICFDLTDRVSFNDVRNYHREIVCYGGDNVSIILIATKLDLIDTQDDLESVVSQQEFTDFCQEYGFIGIYTSAKTGRNVDLAFSCLVADLLEKRGVVCPIEQHPVQESVSAGSSVSASIVGFFRRAFHSEAPQDEDPRPEI